MALVLTGTLTTAVAPSLATMALARALVGLGYGTTAMVGIVYLMQAGPPHQRTRRGNMYEGALITRQRVQRVPGRRRDRVCRLALGLRRGGARGRDRLGDRGLAGLPGDSERASRDVFRAGGHPGDDRSYAPPVAPPLDLRDLPGGVRALLRLGGGDHHPGAPLRRAGARPECGRHRPGAGHRLRRRGVPADPRRMGGRHLRAAARPAPRARRAHGRRPPPAPLGRPRRVHRGLRPRHRGHDRLDDPRLAPGRAPPRTLRRPRRGNLPLRHRPRHGRRRRSPWAGSLGGAASASGPARSRWCWRSPAAWRRPSWARGDGGLPVTPTDRARASLPPGKGSVGPAHSDSSMRRASVSSPPSW